MEECKLQRHNSQHCGTTIEISAGRAEVVILLSTQAAELKWRNNQGPHRRSDWCVHVIMRYWLDTNLIQYRSSTWCLLSHLRKGSTAGYCSPAGQPQGRLFSSQNRRLIFRCSSYILQNCQSLIKIKCLCFPCDLSFPQCFGIKITFIAQAPSSRGN